MPTHTRASWETHARPAMGSPHGNPRRFFRMNGPGSRSSDVTSRSRVCRATPRSRTELPGNSRGSPLHRARPATPTPTRGSLPIPALSVIQRRTGRPLPEGHSTTRGRAFCCEVNTSRYDVPLAITLPRAAENEGPSLRNSASVQIATGIHTAENSPPVRTRGSVRRVIQNKGSPRRHSITQQPGTGQRVNT